MAIEKKATGRTVQEELKLFDERASRLRAIGQFGPDSFANVSNSLVAAIEKANADTKDVCQGILLVAHAVSRTHYHVTMKPLVSYAHGKLEGLGKRRGVCDEALAEACRIVLTDYKSIQRDVGGQDLLPVFWNACAEKIFSPKLRQKVAEQAVLVSKRGSRLRAAAEALLPHEPLKMRVSPPANEHKKIVEPVPAPVRRQAPRGKVAVAALAAAS